MGRRHPPKSGQLLARRCKAFSLLAGGVTFILWLLIWIRSSLRQSTLRYGMEAYSDENRPLSGREDGVALIIP